MIRVRLACLLFSLVGSVAHAAPIADSIADFSNVQGQNGWYYGFFNQGPDNSTAYSPGSFQNFTTFGVVGAGVWGASDAQVGSQNNVYLGLGSATGHPTGLKPPDQQDSIIWAVRRYVSEVAGDIDIALDLGKDNTNPNGGGITGRVFLDGVEIYTQFAAATNGAGFQPTLVRNVALDSIIDFLIDPLGVAINQDGPFSPRADGTRFSAVISAHTVPVAPTAWLVLAALAALRLTTPKAAARRRSGH